MKLAHISEAKYSGHTEPGFVSVDWGEDVDLYGPFKNYEAGEQFEAQLLSMIKAAGHNYPPDIDIFSINAHAILDPQEAINELEKRIQERS